MTVTVAIVQFNTGDVLQTVLQNEATIPVMATAVAPFLAWERNLLNTLKPRMIPAPGEADEAGDFADINSMYALVEGRDFPVGNVPARGWTWNFTRNAKEAIFAEPAPEAGTQTDALNMALEALAAATAAVEAAIAKG
jgi:hypothetical protein